MENSENFERSAVIKDYIREIEIGSEVNNEFGGIRF